MPPKETTLSPPPEDGISSVVFAPSSNNLMVTSWDETVRIYGDDPHRLLRQFSHESPVLDGAFISESAVCTGAVDGTVRMWDINASNPSSSSSSSSSSASAGDLVGRHDGGAKCVELMPRTRALVTGGWDATVRVWDPRAPHCQGSHAQPGKVFALAVSDMRVVVGTAARHVHVYDQRNLTTPEQKRESSLQHQTRCIRCFPDNSGYAVGSVEGRVAVEYFNPSAESQRRKFAFKCHRANVGGVDYVYPVNSIAFHPLHGTFATGGCDGHINVWDGANRKRICQFHRYSAGIASMDFNHDGSLLAIAASYTYEEGEKDHPPDKVFVRAITDADVKPKPRK